MRYYLTNFLLFVIFLLVTLLLKLFFNEVLNVFKILSR